MAKFNREKVLRQLEFKRKWRSYSRYVYIAVPCVLCCLLCLYFAYSKFFVSDAQAVIRTTVGDFIYGDVVISAYIDGEYSSTIPGKNDGYVVDKVSCDNGAVGEWNNDDWGLLTTNLSKRTKCNVYFKKVVSKVPDIIAQLDTTGKCPTMNADGSVNVTAVEATDGYLCKAKDAYGDSYYYRGNVTNNYVKFGKWAGDTPTVVYGYYINEYREYDSMEACQNASYYNKNCTIINRAGKDMYWRIIRINGDGSVRVIYDGTSAHANGESSSDRQIGTSVFNNSYNDNAYVGYMYGQTGASTYAAAHANTNDSTIKAYIDNWYKTNIVGTANEQYLADNVFCNDRSISTYTTSPNTKLGYGTNSTYYRWVYGPWSGTNYGNMTMMLTCPQKNDAFTVSDTTNGNGALTYPVGLLSTDEIVLAGGWLDNNSGYYLYSGQSLWGSSPIYFTGSYAGVHYVGALGNADGRSYVNRYNAVRPVFNLKAEVLVQGSGTASDPYRISSD